MLGTGGLEWGKRPEETDDQFDSTVLVELTVVHARCDHRLSVKADLVPGETEVGAVVGSLEPLATRSGGADSRLGGALLIVPVTAAPRVPADLGAR